jgi:GlpG protein
MRQLGTVPDRASAQRFADYLFTKGISLSVDPAPGGWSIWVRNEDHLAEARREFAEYQAAPDAAVYRDAARPAEQLRAEEQRRAAEAKKNYVNVSRRWARAQGVSRTPVTALLLAASIAVALFSDLGTKKEVIARLTIDNYAPKIDRKQFEEALQAGQGEKLEQLLAAVKAGEVPIVPRYLWERQPWRLITPIFLHFGMMHIVFNMLMLWQLGIPIERVIGSFRYALLVLLIAITSNVGEYLWGIHLVHVEGISGVHPFGGMSGVLYGLFGYAWMKSRYDPQSGFMISRNVVVWMVGWFFICLSGVFAQYIGNVANMVHGVGLVVGMIVGRLPSLWRSLR